MSRPFGEWGTALNPEQFRRRWTLPVRLTAVFAVAACALAGALFFAEAMLTPPPRDLVELGVYLALCGGATILGGWGLLLVLERRLGLSLLARFALITFVGTLALVVNMIVLARLMFISTDHDLQVLMATALFGGVVSVAFATLAAMQTITRIGQVGATVRNLAEGSLGITTGVAGRDEVGALAADVDALSSRLADAHAERLALDSERRELTAAISHDLRTPLSTIRAMIDALEDGVVSEPVEMKRYLVAIRRDVERLNRMIDDLFELAQIDAGAMRLLRRPVPLDEIVAEVVDAMRVRAERAGVRLDLRVHDEPRPAMLDGDRLERAISNLLLNSLEHTPPGGCIGVDVRQSGSDVAVEVSDTGEGIREEDLPNIWTRFYRAERSRARLDSSDGAGLGLAITKGIVELHGGQVAVRSRLGAGATFTVILPLGEESDHG